MRLCLAAVGLVLLAGCGESESQGPVYAVEQAATCIRAANPPGTSGSSENERPGSFMLIFGEDRYNYEGLILVVGYGPDSATALKREHEARDAIREDIRKSPPAWGNDDGNVVYETFGPTQAIGTAQVLPQGVSRAEMTRLSAESSRGMREAVEHCLDEARK